MKIIGIICEYNPFHLGHMKQLDYIRRENEEDCAIVCLMSGNFVQRGAPAIVDKSLRAKAAVLCGADLVLELPLTASLSSAENFASHGVRILAPFCDSLCFGAETSDKEALLAAARTLLSPEFPAALREGLDRGLSFPAARQQAVEKLGTDGSLLASPNNILAVEYCKAIQSQNAALIPMPILREGSYHTELPDAENPSATSLRQLLLTGSAWQNYVPEKAQACFQDARLHTLQDGERGILAKLRVMTDQEFEALPYGSEGLWRKFMHAARREATLESILTAVKSKRYTRTRLQRMLMCGFLGLTQADLDLPAPYTRVLAFNDRGRMVLNSARETGSFPNAGEPLDDPYQLLEQRAGRLYGLFAQDTPETPGQEAARRVFYLST